MSFRSFPGGADVNEPICNQCSTSVPLENIRKLKVLAHMKFKDDPKVSVVVL